MNRSRRTGDALATALNATTPRAPRTFVTPSSAASKSSARRTTAVSEPLAKRDADVVAQFVAAVVAEAIAPRDAAIKQLQARLSKLETSARRA